MDKRNNKVFDCDVFCIGDLDYFEDITITGNLFVEGSVNVSSIETGGDLFIRAGDTIVMAQALKAVGEIDIVAFFLDSSVIDGRDGIYFRQSYLYD